ncbi:hypothetical protein LXL04_017240 [Taraxacum kok-saghyz]
MAACCFELEIVASSEIGAASSCVLESKCAYKLSCIMDCSSPNVVEKKKYKPKHVWNTDTSTYFKQFIN